MSLITDKFGEVCKGNGRKVAFYFEESGKVCSKNYKELFEDVEKAKAGLIEGGVKSGEKLLAFASPDYNLLVYMLASFKLGAAVMYVDIFAKQDSLQSFFDDFKPDYVLMSNRTRFLKPFFKYVRGTKVINVDKPLTCYTNCVNCDVRDDAPALITMTTGTSSRPKAFVRTHRDLFNQLKLIRNNMKAVEPNEVILTTSYIYAFANLMRGITTVLPNINLSLKRRTNSAIKKLKMFGGLGVTTIMTTPDFCLRLPNLFSDVKRLYFGGAILNFNEAREIQSKYAKSEIWYIYGSTECALISGIRLGEYLEVLEKSGRCLLGEICKGVRIRIGEDGHILINSDALLRQELGKRMEEEYYDINDIGSFEHGMLYYIGKDGTIVKVKGKEYCANEIEQQVILRFRELSKCAILECQGTNYAFVEGVVNKRGIKEYLAREYGIKKVISLRQIPRDVKHHTKIDYAKLRFFCKRFFMR